MINNEIEKHKILKQAAEYCYDVNHRTPPVGYQPLGIGTMNNGFEACVLKKGNDIIIAFKGTDNWSIKDYRNDIAMLRGRTPNQKSSAEDLYKSIKKEYPNCNIVLTGHSLGGSLAQMLGAMKDVETVTFNAYGTKEILQNNGINVFHSDKITNYCNPDDSITTCHAENHIGKCYKIYSSDNSQYTHHELERMKPLETRILTNPDDLNYIKRQEDRAKEKAWEYYRKTGRHMPIYMPSTCAGTYPVSGYTRNDGTKVNGYTRTCGAKHNH